MRLPSIARIRPWILARMERLWWQLAPRRQTSELAAVAVDTVRPRRELVLENAVLRHQVSVLRRRSKRPTLHLVDRLKLLLGARWLPSWRRVIVLIQPETVLRWHRAGFRRFLTLPQYYDQSWSDVGEDSGHRSDFARLASPPRAQ